MTALDGSPTAEHELLSPIELGQRPRHQVLHLAPVDRQLQVDDGRVVVKPGPDSSQQLLTVRVATGERAPLAFESGLRLPEDPHGRQWNLRDAGPWAPARGPDGTRVFYLWIVGRRTFVTSLEPGGTTLTAPIPAPHALGFAPDGTLLVLTDAKRLERVHLRSGRREVVFPRR